MVSSEVKSRCSTVGPNDDSTMARVVSRLVSGIMERHDLARARLFCNT
jgi:hypothetical protein